MARTPARLLALSLILVGAVSLTGSDDAAAATLTVRLERGTEAGMEPNWVSVQATVLDSATGAGVSEGFEVYVAGRLPDGTATEPFLLAPQRDDGVFAGFVIVPRGGAWTLTASVLTKLDEGSKEIPATHATATLNVDVVAKTLESGEADPSSTGNASADKFEAIVLFVHTLAALAWAGIVGVLALMAHPRGRKALSAGALAWIDERVGSIGRALGWLTGSVVVTGIYNTLESTPYDAPFTPAEFREVSALPYGRPYFLVLIAKVAVYAVMLAAAVPVLARARAAAGVRVPSFAGAHVAAPQPARSPWPARSGAGAGVAVATGGPGPGAGSGEVRLPTPAPEPPRPAGKSLKVPYVVLAAGLFWITLAVTLLKFLHILIEAAG